MVSASVSESDAPPDVSALLARWAGWTRALAYRYARLLHVDADDFFQELALTALASGPKFDPSRGTFSNWVAMIARRVYRNTAVRQTRAVGRTQVTRRLEGRGRDVDEIDVLTSAPDPSAPDPADQVGRRERQRAVGAALAHLPPAQRKAVRTRFWSADPRLGHSGRAHLRSALAALREHLAPPTGDAP